MKNTGIIDFEANSFDELDNWVKETGAKLDTRIIVINKEGMVVADSDYMPADMDDHLDREEIQEVLDNGDNGLSIRKSDILDIEMFYLAVIGTLTRVLNFMSRQLESRINQVSEEKNRASCRSDPEQYA
ncbi:MAG TPA: hypothetical protein VKY40_05995 [Halanaerobiales bacterium]|nr:hypothetical protein [Halanaerobiales bacterium]